MVDKFEAYQVTEQKQRQFSEYIHLNMKLISTKMLSEMRRKLNIEPEMTNKDGYISLMVSIWGRMLNECIYSIAGLCQSCKLEFVEIVPRLTIDMIFNLIEGKNPLQGRIRTDIPDDLEKFKKYYQENIDALRAHLDALPKDCDGN